MKKPRNCPRCGQPVGLVAGLYRCDRDGQFDPGSYQERRHPLPPRDADADLGNLPWAQIDGRAIPLDRRFR